MLKAKQNARPTDVDEEGTELLKMAIMELGLTSGAYDRTVKIAGTIAQIDNSLAIRPEHISEAIGYRSLDRNLWAV